MKTWKEQQTTDNSAEQDENFAPMQLKVSQSSPTELLP